jgi:hypothetical protein
MKAPENWVEGKPNGIEMRDIMAELLLIFAPTIKTREQQMQDLMQRRLDLEIQQEGKEAYIDPLELAIPVIIDTITQNQFLFDHIRFPVLHLFLVHHDNDFTVTEIFKLFEYYRIHDPNYLSDLIDIFYNAHKAKFLEFCDIMLDNEDSVVSSLIFFVNMFKTDPSVMTQRYLKPLHQRYIHRSVAPTSINSRDIAKSIAVSYYMIEILRISIKHVVLEVFGCMDEFMEFYNASRKYVCQASVMTHELLRHHLLILIKGHQNNQNISTMIEFNLINMLGSLGYALNSDRNTIKVLSWIEGMMMQDDEYVLQILSAIHNIIQSKPHLTQESEMISKLFEKFGDHTNMKIRTLASELTTKKSSKSNEQLLIDKQDVKIAEQNLELAKMRQIISQLQEKIQSL